MWIFLAFLAVPLIEIGLFIQVGGLIGLWPTLAVVVLTAVVGTALVRREGARALEDLRGSLSEMRDPTTPLAHGAMIFLAGALLLTPGFFTDAVGIALLIRPVRNLVLRHLTSRVTFRRFEMGSRFQTGPMHDGWQGPPRRPQDPGVIDADEFAPVEPRNGDRGNSGWTRH